MYYDTISDRFWPDGDNFRVLYYDDGVRNLVFDSLLLHLFHCLSHDVIFDNSGSEDSQLTHPITQLMCIA